MTNKYIFSVLIVAIFGIVGFGNFASAHHSWDGYHWARTANPFTLKLGNNLTSGWNSYLSAASTKWSASDVLNTSIIQGTNNKSCRPVAGRVEVCNSKYGNNNWLGLTSIHINGTHITDATLKVNDTYFAKTYNTPAWKNLVMCHELGHTLGLDHRDEVFDNANLGTCLDYTSIPEGNESPDQHDFDVLEEIYAHLDSSTTLSQIISPKRGQGNGEDRSEWGKAIGKDGKGRDSEFERDLGDGNKVITHVFWTVE